MGSPYFTAAYPAITARTQTKDFISFSPSVPTIPEMRVSVNG